MKYRRHFHKIIYQVYPEFANSIRVETEEQYHKILVETVFSKSSSNPLDKRLNYTAYFLAFIQTLERKGFDFEKIRSVCLDVTYEYVRPKNILQVWIKKVPPKLSGTWFAKKLIKALDKKVSRKGNEDGFLARIITDKAETYGLGYGIDILECGICKLFAKYGAQKYVGILCEVDKITSGLAGLEMVRTGTIANGADKCDFRYKKK